MPKDYKTSTGALNKSRALQYCWEDSVNLYSDEEWIVHLDEETLVTEESTKGTFLSEGTHSVLERIWVQGSYPSQWLPQGERGPPKESKSPWIEIFHGGSH